jgi:hypothetical protein
MRVARTFGLTATVAIFASACSPSPTMPNPQADRSPGSPSAAWGPETPHFNLQIVLRGDGFGLVKFRQPNDDASIIYLDTWVRDLAPNTSYVLQRAVDPTIDGQCTSTGWLTLGKGLAAQPIVTDATGTGREELFRDVSAFPVGSRFDIHFRVINSGTAAVVLQSGCYEFTISR